MAIALTETANFDSQVVVPEDFVDDETAASLDPALQSLANRTRYLKPVGDLFIQGGTITPASTVTIVQTFVVQGPIGTAGADITADGNLVATHDVIADGNFRGFQSFHIDGNSQVDGFSAVTGQQTIGGNLIVGGTSNLANVNVSGAFAFTGSGRVIRPVVTIGTSQTLALGHDYYCTGMTGDIQLLLPTGAVNGDEIEVRTDDTTHFVNVYWPTTSTIVWSQLQQSGTWPSSPIPAPGTPYARYKFVGTTWRLWDGPGAYAGS